MEFPGLKIDQVEEGDRVRLRVAGELDMASAPLLKRRLELLRDERRAVVLDLSELEFLDSQGIHLLCSAMSDSRQDGWHFEVDPDLQLQAKQVLRMVNVYDHIINDADGTN